MPYLSASIPLLVRRRVVWLLLLFAAEAYTGTVLRAFDTEIAKVVALSYFIPLLIGTGGNIGSQTTTTLVRAMGLGEVRLRDVGPCAGQRGCRRADRGSDHGRGRLRAGRVARDRSPGGPGRGPDHRGHLR